MKSMHRIDPVGAAFSAGMKTGFAAIFVGLIVVLGLGFAVPAWQEATPSTPAAAAEPAPAGGGETTVYFPSQYKLDATQPEEHVQAF